MTIDIEVTIRATNGEHSAAKLMTTAIKWALENDDNARSLMHSPIKDALFNYTKQMVLEGGGK